MERSFKLMGHALSRAIILLAVLGLVSGCASNKSKKEVGGEIGLLVGTVIGVGLAVATGSDDGMDEGMLLGAAAGAIVGGMAGSYFGEKLDEMDQMKADMAALTALRADDARTVDWKSEQNEDVGGSAQVVADAESAGGECKIVRHVLNISGEEVTEEQEYCLNSAGSWVLQS